MHILVTGGAGFIGSHTVDALLKDGHAVTVLDDLSTGKKENLQASKSINFIKGDCGDTSIVERIIPEVDAVIHLAAIASVQRSREDWMGTHRTNLTATIALLDAIAKDGRKLPFVYASSAAVMGDPDASLLPLKEDTPIAPLTPYGADKAGCELHARAATAIYGIPTLGLRFFNVYGPRQDPSSPYSGVISIFARKLSQGEPITIFGDGAQTRDFIYISDIVSYITNGLNMLVSGSTVPAVLHACTGNATSLLELSDVIASLLDSTPTIKHAAAREGDIVHSLGAPQNGDNALNIKEKTALKDGLAHLLAAQEQYV